MHRCNEKCIGLLIRRRRKISKMNFDSGFSKVDYIMELVNAMLLMTKKRLRTLITLF